MQSIEQDEVFFDTSFNKHTELYEEFKLTVVLPVLAKHSISYEDFSKMLETCSLKQ
jgi:uncharacterized protein YozE (UPF0346 family)